MMISRPYDLLYFIIENYKEKWNSNPNELGEPAAKLATDELLSSRVQGNY